MKKLFNEMVRFGIVGIINTLLGYILITTFYNVFHWNYWISSGTSYVIGGIFSYFANKSFTFKAEGHTVRYVFKFAINIIVCYLLAYGIARPLVRSVMAGYAIEIIENVALIAGMGLFIIINFIGQKFLVFSNIKKRDDEE